MKKVLLSVLAVALVATVAIGGTTAYLTSTDADKNTMTVGNVKIEQLEYERVTDANGDWVSTGTTDKYGYTPDELQEFTQDKPLLPAVFADGAIKWDDRTANHQQSWAQVGAPGSNQLFDDSVKNAQDKFVFVKNTGNADAYVRTLVALEQGAVAAADFKHVIMTNVDGSHWTWETVATDVAVNGNTYYILGATYAGPTSNPTGILAPDAISYASLMQVYMRPEATNDDVVAIDGNENGKYDILVLSQAVQAKGFDAAATALNAAFGELNATNAAEWFADIAPVAPTKVATADELVDALAAGESVKLTADIALDAVATVPEDAVATLDLNGYTITAADGELFAIENAGDLTVNGDGEIKSSYAALYSTNNLTINGGTYSATNGCGVIVDDMYGGTTSTVTVNGGTFYGMEILNPTVAVINDGTFYPSVDPDGWYVDDAHTEFALLVRPDIAYIPDDCDVTLNGGTFEGDVYVYYGSNTNFVDNGATINGELMNNL